MKETIPVMINDSLARQMAHSHAYDKSLGAMHKEDIHLDSLKDVDYDYSSIDYTPSGSSNLFESVSSVIWILLILAVIGFIAYWAYRSGLFDKRQKEEEEEEDEEVEDDIHAINFDDEMEEALRRHDYAGIVRLVYLRTLHTLDERHTIRWHISKTPSQYANEVHHAAFDRMTHHFQYVRYGKFPATQQMSDEMQALRDEVLDKKGGDG